MGYRSDGAPQCPGCHIGCDLDDPQCGRGLKIRASWLRGEEIPQRRGPGGSGPGPDGPHPGGPGGPGGPGPRGPLSPEDKLNFLLTGILPRKLEQQPGTEDDKASILIWLTRQEGAMSYSVMPERARVNPDTLYANLEQLLEEGLIEDRYTEWGAQHYWITEAGRARAKQAEEQQRNAVRERYAALSDVEKEQLIELLEKLL